MTMNIHSRREAKRYSDATSGQCSKHLCLFACLIYQASLIVSQPSSVWQKLLNVSDRHFICQKQENDGFHLRFDIPSSLEKYIRSQAAPMIMERSSAGKLPRNPLIRQTWSLRVAVVKHMEKALMNDPHPTNEQNNQSILGTSCRLLVHSERRTPKAIAITFSTCSKHN